MAMQEVHLLTSLKKEFPFKCASFYLGAGRNVFTINLMKAAWIIRMEVRSLDPSA